MISQVYIMKKTVSKNSQLKIWSAVIFALISVGLMFFFFSGGNLEIIKSVFREDMSKDEIRDTLDNFGIRGYVTIGILSMLQVILTFLPAEPVQVIAGIAFGFLKGGLICLLGVFIGNTIIYILYKIYGERLTEWFEHNLEFDFDKASKSVKVCIVIFILYFLPAIPYGLICFFSASLNLKYPRYIILKLSKINDRESILKAWGGGMGRSNLQRNSLWANSRFLSRSVTGQERVE